MKSKNKITNPIFKELINLKLIQKKNIIKINNKTRDSNISVLQDKKSRVIFLEKLLRNKKYYKSKNTNRKKIFGDSYSIINLKNKLIETQNLDDDQRRCDQFKKYIKNKNILDYGCGAGGFVLKALRIAKKCSAIEVNNDHINNLKNKINIADSIESVNEKFDCITMFHVLEHMPSQVDIIKKIKKKLKKKGNLIIEVPSALDFLLKFKNLKEFKNFTFWSEHLILHTEKSLKKILLKSGFSNIKILFHQRYNFANHLGWFIDKKPGGHKKYREMSDYKLEKHYIDFLKKTKSTDTLVALATNN